MTVLCPATEQAVRRATPERTPRSHPPHTKKNTVTRMRNRKRPSPMWLSGCEQLFLLSDVRALGIRRTN